MRSLKNVCAAFAALVSIVSVQSPGYAGAAFRSGHVKFTAFKHFKVTPPAPVQTTSTVNVRNFGATGNGTTDDTAAIQNAIAAAQASGQGVLFPAGTYLHASVITANGVALIGVGGASVLLANTPASSAVILSGVSPSIQNIVVNSVPAGSGSLIISPNAATLAVVGAQNFSVQGITIVQGNSRFGVFLQQSAIGQVAGVTFNGSGGSSDYGFLIDGCANTSILGNVFSSETFGGVIGFTSFVPNSIAVIGNNIAASIVGLQAATANNLDIEQNQISSTFGTGFPLQVISCSNYQVSKNVLANAAIGLQAQASAGQSGVVFQNIIRNCSSAGASLATSGTGAALQFISNAFGECGISSAVPVIVASASTSADSLPILNNVYGGHANMLTFYIQSSNHLNVVAGNSQTQTTLANSIP